jgi:hypothetical protein
MLRIKCGRRSLREQQKSTNGRMFSSNLIKPNVSFAGALRGHTDQKIHQETATGASTSDPEPSKMKQETGQSVPAPSVNSELQDNILRAVTLVQQIMMEVKDAVSAEAKILIITKLYNTS